MIGLKEKAGVLPEVELDNYPSVLSGVARIDVDPLSGTVRVVPSVVVDSCLAPALCPGDALPAYRPTEIVYDGRRYILREPLECEVTWELEAYFIRYRPFGITVAAVTLSSAIAEFAFEFDHDYCRYNELASAGNSSGLRLGARLEGIRLLMNAMVVSVTDL